jgi:hypothetical protein
VLKVLLKRDVLIGDVDTIERNRQDSVKKALDIVKSFVEQYQGPMPLCDTTALNYKGRLACDGMMLGTLLKSAAAKGLYPPPESPYPGLTLEGVVSSVRSLEISSYCHQHFGSRHQYGKLVSHNVFEQICWEATAVGNVSGLNLSDFK